MTNPVVVDQVGTPLVVVHVAAIHAMGGGTRRKTP